ncbi:MAG: hypothetical protein U9N84_04140, partial [Actinomycetota bacterium]|nr:hypothetical protein [Actinomycetota bacterium]
AEEPAVQDATSATHATETFLGAPRALTLLVCFEVAVDDVGEASGTSLTDISGPFPRHRASPELSCATLYLRATDECKCA